MVVSGIGNNLGTVTLPWTPLVKKMIPFFSAAGVDNMQSLDALVM